jgi:hypothetical protein
MAERTHDCISFRLSVEASARASALEELRAFLVVAAQAG